MIVKERPGSTPQNPQYTLYCDCCTERDAQGMAYWDGHAIVITQESHGRRHVLKLALDKIPKICATNTSE